MNKYEMMGQISKNITVYFGEKYLREEILPEYLKLQQELVNLAFNEEHADH